MCHALDKNAVLRLGNRIVGQQLKGFGATRIADTCEQLAEMLLL